MRMEGGGGGDNNERDGNGVACMPSHLRGQIAVNMFVEDEDRHRGDHWHANGEELLRCAQRRHPL